MKTILSISVLAGALFFGCGSDDALLGTMSSAVKADKITVCHHTHSVKNPTVTIRVSANSWAAHQSHGDTQGDCEASCSATGGDCNTDVDPNGDTPCCDRYALCQSGVCVVPGGA